MFQRGSLSAKVARFSAVALGLAMCISGCGAAGQASRAFTVESADLQAGVLATTQVFDGFGCTGSNVSPAIHWANAPAGTKSFAVTLRDPDAPTDGGFWHWAMFNIPASTNALPAGAGQLKQGAGLGTFVNARNDYGSASYGGACPPAGDKAHHYVLTVYALNVDHLDLPSGMPAALVSYMVKSSALSSATLSATYSRPGPVQNFSLPPTLPEFKLTSAEVLDGGVIGTAQQYDQFGCTGKNTPPSLRWSGAPAGTRSFVVTMRDPDAPTDSGFWHWTVFDIDRTQSALKVDANSLASSSVKSGVNDYGSSGYGGPCPPVGAKPHRYIFTVYAMGIETLGLDPTASGALVGFMARNNALAMATLTATLGR